MPRLRLWVGWAGIVLFAAYAPGAKLVESRTTRLARELHDLERAPE